MSRLLSLRRRLYSTTSSSTSATSIAAQFLQKTQALPPQTNTQTLSPTQLSQLTSTLSRPLPTTSSTSSTLPPARTILPPCYHLAYFTPSQIESDLGPDGTDTTFNPPKPFTRRMWAGGELVWEKGNRLRVGDEVRESTRLVSCGGKKTRGGEEMVVVGVEKVFENERGVAVLDRRNWIFRPEITTPLPLTPQPPTVPLPTAPHTRDFTQTPITLFRFSAVTFNAHKIHYNREWCREVEGHRDCVVHGPLNLINMVDLWRDVRENEGNRGGEDGGLVFPRRIKYRATSPLYVGETYRVCMEEEVEGVTDVRIVDGFGKVAMVGSIESV